MNEEMADEYVDENEEIDSFQEMDSNLFPIFYSKLNLIYSKIIILNNLLIRI